MKAIKSNMSNDGKVLHCPNCNAVYSGNASDYFLAPDDYVFTCPDCKTELELVELSLVSTTASFT